MAIAKAFASEIAKASAMAIPNPDLLFARVITRAMAKAFVMRPRGGGANKGEAPRRWRRRGDGTTGHGLLPGK